MRGDKVPVRGDKRPAIRCSEVAGCTTAAMDTRLALGRRGFAPQLADVVREARLLVGWTQRELATRARTSQASIWRIERGIEQRLDLLVVEGVLEALGIRATLDLDARHLADRRRQRDGVHARLNGYVARRLERLGWQTASEVPLGERAPRGWIDCLAYRPGDRALLVDEIKSDLPDIGALQRSLTFYERDAWAAARAIGWSPRRSVVLLVVLDTAAVARRLADSRDLLTRAFPASIGAFATWLADPAAEAPRGWGIAAVNPVVRGANWLRPTVLDGRRGQPAYADYADAARRLLGS